MFVYVIEESMVFVTTVTYLFVVIVTYSFYDTIITLTDVLLTTYCLILSITLVGSALLLRVNKIVVWTAVCVILTFGTFFATIGLVALWVANAIFTECRLIIDFFSTSDQIASGLLFTTSIEISENAFAFLALIRLVEPFVFITINWKVLTGILSFATVFLVVVWITIVLAAEFCLNREKTDPTVALS
jgi:hypothetical protein